MYCNHFAKPHVVEGKHELQEYYYETRSTEGTLNYFLRPVYPTTSNHDQNNNERVNFFFLTDDRGTTR